jgi:hypothetical protein
MPSISIKVHRCNDPEPAFQGPPPNYQGELEFQNCTLIEQGTGSGGTAIGFGVTDLATGNTYFVQTSAAILRGIVSALYGAETNWAENPVENIYK